MSDEKKYDLILTSLLLGDAPLNFADISNKYAIDKLIDGEGKLLEGVTLDAAEAAQLYVESCGVICNIRPHNMEGEPKPPFAGMISMGEYAKKNKIEESVVYNQVKSGGLKGLFVKGIWFINEDIGYSTALSPNVKAVSTSITNKYPSLTKPSKQSNCHVAISAKQSKNDGFPYGVIAVCMGFGTLVPLAYLFFIPLAVLAGIIAITKGHKRAGIFAFFMGVFMFIASNVMINKGLNDIDKAVEEFDQSMIELDREMARGQAQLMREMEQADREYQKAMRELEQIQRNNKY